jgi:hypothetical protein
LNKAGRTSLESILGRVDSVTQLSHSLDSPARPFGTVPNSTSIRKRSVIVRKDGYDYWNKGFIVVSYKEVKKVKSSM